MTETPKNLIDLGKYPPNDVQLITREYLRCAYLDTIEAFVKDYAELDEDNQSRINVIETLHAFERLIVVFDGNEEFIQAVHSTADGEDEKQDEEFERF